MKPLKREVWGSILKLEERVKALEVSRKGYTGKTILPDGSFDIPRAIDRRGVRKSAPVTIRVNRLDQRVSRGSSL